MKIRTDFVTNSSSYCSAEILIDNIVLLEILVKYKDMGTFGEENDSFSVGSYPVSGERIENTKDKTLTPAFYCNDIDFEGSPTTLNEVLEKLIETMDEWRYDYDVELYEHLVEELQQREEEIMSSFIEVSWESRLEKYGGAYRHWSFTYHHMNGESYDFEKLGHDWWFSF